MGTFDQSIGYTFFDQNGNILSANKGGVTSLATKPYGTSKITLYPIDAIKAVTVGNTPGLLVGAERKLYCYSYRTNIETKTIKTRNVEVTAINTMQFKGINYFIIGLGNDWAEGLNSL